MSLAYNTGKYVYVYYIYMCVWCVCMHMYIRTKIHNIVEIMRMRMFKVLLTSV